MPVVLLYTFCILFVYCVFCVYLATTADLYICFFPIFLIFLYCNIQFVCCLYIWPLVLLYIFTTFQYFMVSCPTIRCQYWRLTNNKYTFQYNRDKCHRGTYFGKKYFHNIWAANILWWISKAQEFWGLHNTIQIDNYLTRTTCSSLLKLFFLLWKSSYKFSPLYGHFPF